MDAITTALEDIYGSGDARVQEARDGISELLARYEGSIPHATGGWDQTDAFLITYGNSIVDQGETPLQVLRRVLRDQVAEAISYVHVLPFCPYTSDDGFSVVDYRQIDGQLGNWRDIEDLAGERRLAADLVINHCSQESAYVRGYLADDPHFRDFCIAVDPDTDLSAVVRPRTSPLLHPFTKHDG
ncbi:MAG: alpha-amylase family glycosyl hydrolase, partial [Planctomycetota bacterium]